MPPGYHWLAAGVSRLVGDDLVALRLLNFGVSVIGLVVLYLWLSGRRPSAEAALLIAPLACSNFYVKSAAWMVTDNAAVVLVACILITMISVSKLHGRALLACLFSVAAVMTRQVYAWIALPMAVCAFVTKDGGLRGRPQAIWFAAAACPLVCVSWLVVSWGGLVPPRWQSVAVGAFSFASWAYLLSITALFGIFYQTFAGRPADRATLLRCLLAAVVGLVIALASATSYDVEAGRWGGYLWSVAQALPTIGGRSPLFALLAPLGAVFVYLHVEALRDAGRRGVTAVWSASLIGWIAAMLPVRQVFQRYYEPMVLVFLIVAAGLISAAPRSRQQKAALCGLTALQIAITLATAWRSTFTGAPG